MGIGHYAFIGALTIKRTFLLETSCLNSLGATGLCVDGLVTLVNFAGNELVSASGTKYGKYTIRAVCQNNRVTLESGLLKDGGDILTADTGDFMPDPLTKIRQAWQPLFPSRTAICGGGAVNNLECQRVQTPWGPVARGSTMRVECPAGYKAIGCHFNFYDTNNITGGSGGSLLYLGYTFGDLNAARTQCSKTSNDEGISEGMLSMECCSLRVP